jgi:hypothetical protein
MRVAPAIGTTHRTSTSPVNLKPSRSVQLLEMLIRDGVLSEDDLARELVVRPETLRDFRSGEKPMPLERQLCLALLMIGLAPKYARMGYALRGQVEAATHFGSRSITSSEDVSVVR